MTGKLIGRKDGKIAISPTVRGLWPIFLSYSIIALTMAAFVLNMINFSKIMWPNDEFHAFEMGLIISVKFLSMAFSGMIIGHFTDLFSRKNLFLFILSLIGFAYLLNGFAPEAEGIISWAWFLICNMIAGFGLGGIRPILLSYTNDNLEKENRSQFFGIFHSIAQISLVIGMIISSSLIYAGYWKIYYWSVGIMVILSTFIIGLKIKEPKRAFRSLGVLTEVLEDKSITYNYRLTKKTVKSTILRTTNIVAFIEGIFTCVLLGTLNFLILPYLQTPPLNISSVSTAFIVVLFGMPGAFLGSLGFAKKSDKWGKKNIQIRLDLIAFSIIWLAIAQLFIFLVPFGDSGFTEEQGNNFIFLLSFPQFWLTGVLWFSISSVRAIYQINQPPILQAINLPEAQGRVSSWNQFLETLGQGTGPLIAGAVLSASGQNYILASLVITFIGIPGAILWIYAKRKINGDIENIENILAKRAIELKNLNNTKVASNEKV